MLKPALRVAIPALLITELAASYPIAGTEMRWVAVPSQVVGRDIAISHDPFANADSQHSTAVEASTAANGQTIVSAYQTGRFKDGGASGIGYSVSFDGGNSWTNGSLPGATQFSGGNYDRASDPSVAYDARDQKWMVTSLGLVESRSTSPTQDGDAGSVAGRGVQVNVSGDGGRTWRNPNTVTTSNDFIDKDWITCDNHPQSPFYGRCYVSWDDTQDMDQIYVSYSDDGGRTWSTPAAVPKTPLTGQAGAVGGLGVEPVVQPNGTVVMPYLGGEGFQDTISKDGGVTWSQPYVMGDPNVSLVQGNMRAVPLPSVATDGAGRIYVAWEGCEKRFCGSYEGNSILLYASDDGINWSQVATVPDAGLGPNPDEFIPGLGVDPHTSGDKARISVSFYYYPDRNCDDDTCRLGVAMVSSKDGGKTWTDPVILAHDMRLSWLPQTTLGPMVGDYMQTAFTSDGRTHPVFAVAGPPEDGNLNVAMNTPLGGVGIGYSYRRETGKDIA